MQSWASLLVLSAVAQATDGREGLQAAPTVANFTVFQLAIIVASLNIRSVRLG